MLACPGEFGRLVVPALPVEDVGEQARRGRDVVALAHLLKTPVVRAQLRLGRGQIPGEQLDDGRVERREGRQVEVAELLERGPAPAIEQARALEVPPHRLEVTDTQFGERSGLAVVFRPGQHFLAGGNGLDDRHRTVEGGDRERAEEAAGGHLIAGGGRMPDRALRGGGRVSVAATRPVHRGEQPEGPHQSAVVTHRLELGDLLFHELNHALLPPDALLHGVRVGRVSQLEEGECGRPGGPGRRRQKAPAPRPRSAPTRPARARRCRPPPRPRRGAAARGLGLSRRAARQPAAAI